jgi:hypothetical protein
MLFKMETKTKEKGIMKELLCTIPIVAFYIIFVYIFLRSLSETKLRD